MVVDLVLSVSDADGFVRKWTVPPDVYFADYEQSGDRGSMMPRHNWLYPLAAEFLGRGVTARERCDLKIVWEDGTTERETESFFDPQAPRDFNGYTLVSGEGFGKLMLSLDVDGESAVVADFLTAGAAQDVIGPWWVAISVETGLGAYLADCIRDRGECLDALASIERCTVGDHVWLRGAWRRETAAAKPGIPMLEVVDREGGRITSWVLRGPGYRMSCARMGEAMEAHFACSGDSATVECRMSKRDWYWEVSWARIGGLGLPTPREWKGGMAT